LAYAILEPASGDLATHLLRAKLFSAEGFGIWSNWWYGGHHVPLYSVLFPPLAAALTPQLVAALAAVGTAALFESLAYRHFGPRAWVGSVWFGLGTAASLYAGRLTFAFGMLPATAAVWALQRRRPALACGAAFLTALSSPVAAAFTVLAGAASALGGYRRQSGVRPSLPGIAVVIAAALPVLVLSLAFPEGGNEPFAVSAFVPLPLIGVAAMIALPAQERTLRIGVALYVAACVASFAIPNALGSNVVRLGELVAGPLAAALWWQRRTLLLIAALTPLLYIEFQAPIRDAAGAAGNPAVSSRYYQPLLSVLQRQPGPPFRVEIPFTKYHWEAYAIAPHFPLARGWERQLDIHDNRLFYGDHLTPAAYGAWLTQLAVRIVALPDVPLDYSAVQEAGLIRAGLPYLKLVLRTTHWRIYEVRDPMPLASGAAAVTAMGPNWVDLYATRPGLVRLQVRFTPYWALTTGRGCVGSTSDGWVWLNLRRAGAVRLGIDFALGRVRATTPRCR
jgi:hypothetical protein